MKISDEDNVSIVDSYESYEEQLGEEYQPFLVYKGELMAQRIFESLREDVGNWIVWKTGSDIECCNVKRTGALLSVSEVCSFHNELAETEMVKKAFGDQFNINWLNLCHYRNSAGDVTYDAYYDKFPAYQSSAEGVDSIGDLRRRINEFISEYMPCGENDQVFLCDDLQRYNILHDLLQKRGVAVFLADGCGMSSGNCRVIPADDRISLYSFSKDSIVLVSLPEEKDVLVHTGGDENDEIQVYHSSGDVLGNQWLMTENVDGQKASSLIVRGNTVYNKIKNNHISDDISFRFSSDRTGVDER